MFELVGEISPVQRRISSAWRVTPVFRKMCLRWVFAVVPAMPRVAAVSVRVRPANRLASTLVSLGVRPRRRHGVGAILGIRWRADEHRRNGRGLQPRAEIAPYQRQDVREDGRHIGLGEADRQPGFADPASLRAARARAERSSVAAEGVVACRTPWSL
jgi:hypothetical protein